MPVAGCTVWLGEIFGVDHLLIKPDVRIGDEEAMLDKCVIGPILCSIISGLGSEGVVHQSCKGPLVLQPKLVAFPSSPLCL